MYAIIASIFQPISAVVSRRLIYRLTGGHVGCVVATLNLLRDKRDAEVEAALLPDKLAQNLFGAGGAMRTLLACASCLLSFL